MRFRTLLFLFLGILVTGCTGSPEESVLSAIKDYRLNNVSIEDAMLDEVERLKEEGRTVDYGWRLQKLSETEYEFTTQITAGGVGRKRPVSRAYQWMASKNMVKSKGLRSEVWNLKANNALARGVIRTLSSPKKLAKLRRH